MIRHAAVIVWCLMSAACSSAWTRSELLAAQVVAATARVETECLRDGYRPDQAIRASIAARAIAEMLAHPFPNGEKIRAEVVIVDILLVGLSNGPDNVRERVHSAQVLLMQFQMELARRKRLINLLPTR